MLSLNIDLNKASNLADITEQREAKRQKVEQRLDEDLADKKVDVKIRYWSHPKSDFFTLVEETFEMR